MAAPAVPEIPALGLLLAAIGAALVWVTARGGLAVWRASLGPLLLWTADQLDRAAITLVHRTFHLFGPLTRLLRAVAKDVDHALASAALWGERKAEALFRFFLAMQLWIVREIADLATDVWHALASVHTTVVKPAIRVLDRNAVARIRALEHSAVTTKRALVALISRRVAAAEHRLTRAIAIPAHAVAGVVPRVGRLERRVQAQAHRLTRLEKATAGAAAAALVLTALKSLGLGWTRCANVTRVGKRACGMDTDLLNALLGGTLLLTASVSLEQLARELREPTAVVMQGVRKIVREL